VRGAVIGFCGLPGCEAARFRAARQIVARSKDSL
jgi:hypothetical protein